MKPLAAALAFVLLGSAIAAAFPTAAMAGGDSSPVKSYHAERKMYALRMLREEGLKLQAADGGKLTAAHRAYLDAKLKAIRAGNY